MSQDNKVKKLYNLRMALLSASAFQDLANNFIKPARAIEPKEAKRFLLDNFGHLIASATNMSFAIEIYLKAIISLSGNEPKNIHGLSKLFREVAIKYSKCSVYNFDG